MKTLYLIRHAKSSWKFPELKDHDRPLNKRGKRNAPEMGERLLKRGIQPDLIISSSAKRALITAKYIAEKIKYSSNKIKVTRTLYHADYEDIIEMVQNLEDDISTVMVFGHNPGITDAVNELTRSKVDNVPTTGIAEIEVPVQEWKKMRFGGCRLLSFDYPKRPTN